MSVRQLLILSTFSQVYIILSPIVFLRICKCNKHGCWMRLSNHVTKLSSYKKISCSPTENITIVCISFYIVHVCLWACLCVGWWWICMHFGTCTGRSMKDRSSSMSCVFLNHFSQYFEQWWSLELIGLVISTKHFGQLMSHYNQVYRWGFYIWVLSM